MSKLKGENLTKIYDKEIVALKDVNIEVEEKEIVVILGPSGSGKTTLLNLLTIIDKPTSGKVYLDNNEITNLCEKESAKIRNKNFGFIFQFFYLLPELTVLENVYLPLWIKEKSPFKINIYKEKAENLLKEFQLEKKKNFYPFQLSGGELQRIAICRSLICEPQIIFGDEPTGSIDKDSAKIFFNMIKYLNEKKNITFVIATHNEKFLQFATKVIYLNEGKVEKVVSHQ